ncbi:hypothetical protein DFQ26_006952 [Actinomortierella ambigua]|nr:hypothetical protein DFQ26_006952 [Actinomortierella ambigua]
MQYLSTMPSPLQGMRHLYDDMLKRPETSPTLVTFKILLDACAEQMDMTAGQGYWNDMIQQGILPNKYVSASYIKGWCRVGEFAKAEAVCREALQMSLGTDKKEGIKQAKVALQRRAFLEQVQSQAEGQSSSAPSQSRKRLKAIRNRMVNERMMVRQLARQQVEAFDMSVIEALMQGYVRHDLWQEACRVYEAVDQGRWGNTIRPTAKTLATYFYCCSQGRFVQKAIDTFSRIESGVNRAHQKRHMPASSSSSSSSLMDAEEEGIGAEADELQPSSETLLPEMEWADLLTDAAFFHYFGVLGRSHRADLLVPAWKSLLRLGLYPSPRTVSRLLDCLEDHQWGLSEIKHIQQDLEHNWPEQDWSRVVGDRSGGRFWK